jgi:hypothetical protein
MVTGLTLDSVVSGHLVNILVCECELFHNPLGGDAGFHPSIVLKGMITMRLQRLHFSSNAWPLTLAISWPHSQRVSGSAAIAGDEDPMSVSSCLILRTIIKIVASITMGCLSVNRRSRLIGAPVSAAQNHAMPSNRYLAPPTFLGLSCVTVLIFLQGCAGPIPAVTEESLVHSSVTVGRVVAVLTGDRSRKYEPAVRSFEVQNRYTNERFTVDVQSDNQRFILLLPPGEYELIRVQINEGPFLSMAHLASTFSIGQDAITYLGIWRFGVDSPKYGRRVSVSMISDEEDRAEAIETLIKDEPSSEAGTVRSVLPDPPHMQARLHEVMPYPRIPRYFRRHWW